MLFRSAPTRAPSPRSPSVPQAVLAAPWVPGRPSPPIAGSSRACSARCRLEERGPPAGSRPGRWPWMTPRAAAASVERDLPTARRSGWPRWAMSLGLAREKLGGRRSARPIWPASGSLLSRAHRGCEGCPGRTARHGQGIHPPVLDIRAATNAHGPAGRSQRAAGAVRADVPVAPPEAIETIAYFCAAELLATRHQAQLGERSRDPGRYPWSRAGAAAVLRRSRRRHRGADPPRAAGLVLSWPAGSRSWTAGWPCEPARRSTTDHRRAAPCARDSIAGIRVGDRRGTALLREGPAARHARNRGHDVAPRWTSPAPWSPRSPRTSPDVAIRGRAGCRPSSPIEDNARRNRAAPRSSVHRSAGFSQYIETRYATPGCWPRGSSGVGYLLKDRVADVCRVHRRPDTGWPRRHRALDPEVVSQLRGASASGTGGPGRGTSRPVLSSPPGSVRVLSLMAEGRSNAAIAAELVVSPGRGREARAGIFAKLVLPPSDGDNGASCRAALPRDLQHGT